MEPKVCPVCEHPRVVNLTDHSIPSHNISGKDRKASLRRARFRAMSCKMAGESSICLATTQFGNTAPKTSPFPEQRNLPNPTSDENEGELIPCPYDSCISYERVWGVPMFLLWTLTCLNCIIPLVC